LKKTDFIYIRISPDAKKKLRDKASNLNLNISELIEKLANEPTIFVSKDIRVVLEAIN